MPRHFTLSPKDLLEDPDEDIDEEDGQDDLVEGVEQPVVGPEALKMVSFVLNILLNGNQDPQDQLNKHQH